MRNALRIVGVIIALVFVAGFLLPATNDFEKTKQIAAPTQEVFEMINDLEQWPNWSPWFLAEPDMKLTYGEIRSGEGAAYSWEGEKMGQGRLWISESVANEKVVTNIDFGGGEPSQGIFTLMPDNNGTAVSWRFINENGWNPIARIIGFFFIQPMVEKSYEEGLNNLEKALVKQ